MAVLDRAEAAAIAALLDHLRYGSALPIRRPSYTEPTFLSRPITATVTKPVAPTPPTLVVPDPPYQQILTWRAPIQYMSVISAYAYATLEPAATPGMNYKLQLNGADLPNVNLPGGVEVCKDTLWPLYRRPIHLLITENDVLALLVRNDGGTPLTVTAGFWGWSYNTIDVEMSSLANKGITDA